MKRYTLLIILFISALQCRVAVAEQQGDSLYSYMMTAVENSPRTKAALDSYKAALEAVCPASTIGDPELSVNWYPSPMELVNSRQVATFGLMQMFPWPGSMKAARREKEWQVEKAYEMYRMEGIDLAYRVEEKWYQILATQEKITAIEQNITFLKQIQETALYQYKSTSNGRMRANMSDQLRLQTEALSLEEQLETAQTELTLQKQQLNLLMHREAGSDIVTPDSIVLREMPILSMDDIENASPELAAIRNEQNALEQTEKKMRNMGRPMLGVGAQYMLNEETKMPRMADMNGKDMWMAMFKVSLPIYRRKTNASIREAQLMQTAAAEKYASQLDALESQWLGIVQQAEETKRKIRLLGQQLDLVDRTLELMRAEYVAETTPISDLLETDRQRVALALKLAEAKAKYNTVVAQMEKIAALNGNSLQTQEECRN